MEECGQRLKLASLVCGKKEMRVREGSVFPKVTCTGQANDMARVLDGFL